MEELTLLYAEEEYFCRSCRQLRLNAIDAPAKKCKNCNSTDIIIGNVGELDKQQLLKDSLNEAEE